MAASTVPGLRRALSKTSLAAFGPRMAATIDVVLRAADKPLSASLAAGPTMKAPSRIAPNLFSLAVTPVPPS